MSALPFLLFLSHPSLPLPLSVASSKDALSISSTPGVKLVEEQGGGKRGMEGYKRSNRGKGGKAKEGEKHLT